MDLSANRLVCLLVDDGNSDLRIRGISAFGIGRSIGTYFDLFDTPDCLVEETPT